MGTLELEAEHTRCKHEAIRHFKTAKKMGGTELSLQYLQKLDDDLSVSFLGKKIFFIFYFLGLV